MPIHSTTLISDDYSDEIACFAQNVQLSVYLTSMALSRDIISRDNSNIEDFEVFAGFYDEKTTRITQLLSADNLDSLFGIAIAKINEELQNEAEGIEESMSGGSL